MLSRNRNHTDHRAHGEQQDNVSKSPRFPGAPHASRGSLIAIPLLSKNRNHGDHWAHGEQQDNNVSKSPRVSRAPRGSLIAITLALAVAVVGKVPPKMATVLLPNSSPLVSFRLLFNVGSASDPKGKEGIAALCASMISDGGSRAMSYEQIVEAMYPMATEFHSQVDKEMTVFYGATHVDNLQKYYQIISGMILDPGWRQDDFTRLREDAINFLKVNLRSNNDEELGKEALYNFIYEGHPYGHQNTGTVESLEKLTLDDVEKFYRENYTAANFVVGLAGGYPKGFDAKVESDFAAKLPAGAMTKLALPEPEKIKGLEMQVIDKDTSSTAISLGFPIPVTRSHPDFPALLVMQSYLGQHRSSNSYLYQRLRAIRGLNYGDYAYIEYFPRGMFQFHPDPNLCRQQQIFQIWIRPVELKKRAVHLESRAVRVEQASHERNVCGGLRRDPPVSDEVRERAYQGAGRAVRLCARQSALRHSELWRLRSRRVGETYA
jgi:zinc protease